MVLKQSGISSPLANLQFIAAMLWSSIDPLQQILMQKINLKPSEPGDTSPNTNAWGQAP